MFWALLLALQLCAAADLALSLRFIDGSAEANPIMRPLFACPTALCTAKLAAMAFALWACWTGRHKRMTPWLIAAALLAYLGVLAVWGCVLA